MKVKKKRRFQDHMKVKGSFDPLADLVALDALPDHTHEYILKVSLNTPAASFFAAIFDATAGKTALAAIAAISLHF